MISDKIFQHAAFFLFIGRACLKIGQAFTPFAQKLSVRYRLLINDAIYDVNGIFGFMHSIERRKIIFT